MINNIRKLRYKNSVKIVEEVNNKYVFKKNTRDLNNLFMYLRSRNFNSFPELLNEDREEYEFSYIEDINAPKEQKMVDIIKLIADLHTKTSYYKEVGHDRYLEIYELLNENILYIEGYYNDLITLIEREVYTSPSHYLIARNFSKINSAINFCKKELESWYSLVKDNTKQRVCVVHNNLKTEHLLKNDKDYLISWDKYLIDTPVIDLYKFYKNEKLSNNFDELLITYEKKYKLKEDERKLLFIMLSIPEKFEFGLNEFINTNNVRTFIDYLYKTNELITPYYSINSENEQKN